MLSLKAENKELSLTPASTPPTTPPPPTTRPASLNPPQPTSASGSKRGYLSLACEEEISARLPHESFHPDSGRQGRVSRPIQTAAQPLRKSANEIDPNAKAPGSSPRSGEAGLEGVSAALRETLNDGRRRSVHGQQAGKAPWLSK